MDEQSRIQTRFVKSFRGRLKTITDHVVYTEVFSLFAFWEDIELCHRTEMMTRDMDSELSGYSRFGFQEHILSSLTKGDRVESDLLLREYDALWSPPSLRDRDLVMTMTLLKEALCQDPKNLVTDVSVVMGVLRSVVATPPSYYAQAAFCVFGADTFLAYRNDLALAHTLPIRACYREISRILSSFLEDHYRFLLSDRIECDDPLFVFIGRLWILGYLALAIMTEKSLETYAAKWNRPEFSHSYKCAAKYVASLKGLPLHESFL